MIGSTKFPRAAGMPGMMNRNVMIAPWSVNIWLYMSCVMPVVGPGVSSSVLSARANTPPRRNADMTPIRYITPIRL